MKKKLKIGFKGFTLIEILCVVIILGILAVIVISQLKESKGKINQTVSYWCFQTRDFTLEQTCDEAVKLGLKGVDLVGFFGQGDSLYANWDMLVKKGLKDTMHYPYKRGDAFNYGLNDPNNHEECLAALEQGINDCAKYGFPNVIAFIGLSPTLDGREISREEAIANSVAALNKIKGHAEDKRVTVCVEILNSKIDVEMKGHPNYQGDNLAFLLEVIKRVNSEYVKILFDIYHAYIMEGDKIIELIEENKDYIGYYHTAGVPGRNELHVEGQKIDYRPIMKAIADTGYTGYVSHEFIPISDDPLESLKQAVLICDVE